MTNQLRRLSSLLLLSLSLLVWPVPTKAQIPAASNSSPGLSDILQYIFIGWNTLTRSMTDCKVVADPKATTPPVIYLPADLATPKAIQDLTKTCHVRAEHLPAVIEHLGQIDVSSLHPQGLLYLEHPYVVPGGRFNEMYGWDSYFIIRGLLRDGRMDLAHDMVEDFFFEIDHYGGFLNANRTYYLTRSQPPFLTSMIMAVYDAEKIHNRDWLAKAYAHAVKDYGLWTHAPHLAGSTGLARYYDFGDGPAPEVGKDTASYFRQVARYFLQHPESAKPYLSESKETPPAAANAIGPQYSLELCDKDASHPASKACDQVANVGLTRDLYKGDRSMRESGFDVSFRFDPYSAGTHHFAPVCLNSLLYKAETDLERMSQLLGREDEAAGWRRRAATRREAINQYLWNAQRGLFFDYNFETGKQSDYVYITTFYPLWVGLATPEQAHGVEQNLKLFERPGGLAMSTQQTGAQWDYPYGWAPTHLLAIEGLRRYGFNEDADRVSYEFLSTVLQNFRRDGTIREKYNVVTRSSETHVEAGYPENVVGFGWTNGVFLELFHNLPQTWRERLASR